MYHDLFVYVNGFAGFQVWAMMNKVAVNIQSRSLCTHMLSFLLGKYPGVRMLGQMVCYVAAMTMSFSDLRNPN